MSDGKKRYRVCYEFMAVGYSDGDIGEGEDIGEAFEAAEPTEPRSWSCTGEPTGNGTIQEIDENDEPIGPERNIEDWDIKEES
jgi:hypothetical protein